MALQPKRAPSMFIQDCHTVVMEAYLKSELTALIWEDFAQQVNIDT